MTCTIYILTPLSFHTFLVFSKTKRIGYLRYPFSEVPSESCAYSFQPLSSYKVPTEQYDRVKLQTDWNLHYTILFRLEGEYYAVAEPPNLIR